MVRELFSKVRATYTQLVEGNSMFSLLWKAVSMEGYFRTALAAFCLLIVGKLVTVWLYEREERDRFECLPYGSSWMRYTFSRRHKIAATIWYSKVAGVCTI